MKITDKVFNIYYNIKFNDFKEVELLINKYNLYKEFSTILKNENNQTKTLILSFLNTKTVLKIFYYFDINDVVDIILRCYNLSKHSYIKIKYLYLIENNILKKLKIINNDEYKFFDKSLLDDVEIDYINLKNIMKNHLDDSKINTIINTLKNIDQKKTFIETIIECFNEKE